MQTRKWSDQSGADRYTTEIVLGKFSGVISLIGGKGGGTSGPLKADSPDDYGTTKTTAVQHRKAKNGWESPPDSQMERVRIIGRVVWKGGMVA